MSDSTGTSLYYDLPGEDEKPWLIPLSHQTLLTVTGPDTEKFLQGQVTCDMRRLAQNHLLLGAHCDPKGRMHSSFFAAKLDHATVGLRLHESIAETAQTALKKYAVFFKAEPAIADQFKVFALMGEQAELVISHLSIASPTVIPPTIDKQFSLGEQLTVLRHDKNSYELWVHASLLQVVREQLAVHCAIATPEQWDLVQIVRGLGQVRKSTVGEFIPQMLNFQMLDGISFDKGCYTGQEIVARMHYLGALKKHMYRANTRNTELPAPGTAVFASETGAPAGQVVLAANSAPDQVCLLLVCSEQSAQQPLTLASPDGPRLEFAPLPYF